MCLIGKATVEEIDSKEHSWLALTIGIIKYQRGGRHPEAYSSRQRNRSSRVLFELKNLLALEISQELMDFSVLEFGLNKRNIKLTGHISLVKINGFINSRSTYGSRSRALIKKCSEELYWAQYITQYARQSQPCGLLEYWINLIFFYLFVFINFWYLKKNNF